MGHVPQPLLDVRELRVEFRGAGGVARAVDGVSFTLLPGETLALVGESGSGKSATALSLVRLLPVESASVSGSVRFDQVELLELSDREVRSYRGGKIGMVFQDPMTSLNPALTVGLQLTEAIRLHLKLGRAEARARAVELLDAVGIPAAARRLNDYPHQFSGGMRQRVMIAIALACAPRLILADEITTALDVTTQAQVLDVLKELVSESQTAVLLITHDLGIVARMADRVNVMYAGQVVESAPTDELFENPSMPYTWGLLSSVPRVDVDRTERLRPIQGSPPDLLNLPTGCRFQSRCEYRREICSQRGPDLLEIGTTGTGQPHLSRCWAMQDVPHGGWLRGADRQEAARV